MFYKQYCDSNVKTIIPQKQSTHSANVSERKDSFWAQNETIDKAYNFLICNENKSFSHNKYKQEIRLKHKSEVLEHNPIVQLQETL